MNLKRSDNRMKGILFMALATLATGASAAETVHLTAELTRNGESVARFSGDTTDRVTFPYRDVKTITFNKSVEHGMPVADTVDIGTIGFITPAIMSNGKILIRYHVKYVRLLEMNTTKVGKLQLDFPHTEIFQTASDTTVANGETFQVPESQSNGSKYVLNITASQ
ncbi:hypothetical protein TU82_26435 [Pseudomonas orientalis]|nr:hypothetical protein TU82_26435 [Pseudomonas orientalis]